MLIALASPLRLCASLYRRDLWLSKKLLRGSTVSPNGILWTVKLISTAEAAKRLNVTPSRVRAMIARGRLRAMRIGIMWLIDPKDLDAVKDRKVGRPRKARKSAKR